jgi:hypothetical protein
MRKHAKRSYAKRSRPKRNRPKWDKRELKGLKKRRPRHASATRPYGSSVATGNSKGRPATSRPITKSEIQIAKLRNPPNA